MENEPGALVKGLALPPVGQGMLRATKLRVWQLRGCQDSGFLEEVSYMGAPGGGASGWEDLKSLDQDPFLTAPGQPLPGEGNSLEQVLAVGRLLYLGQVQSAQEGTYTCECSNAAGTSSQEQSLEVLGEPCQAAEGG